MPDIGVVDLQMETLENLSKLYQNPATSDVTIIIGDKKLSANLVPLAAQSEIFQVLLFGNDDFSKSDRQVIELEEVSFNAVKLLLSFVYTGKINLRDYTLYNVADLLKLTHCYGFQKLEKLIVKYLCIAVDAECVRYVLDIAFLINCGALLEQCWTIIEMIVEGIYDNELKLTHQQLMELMDRSPRKVSEVKLFQFAFKLSEIPNFCTEDQKKKIFRKIKFAKMSVEKLYDIVQPTGVISKTELCDLIKNFSLHKVKALEKIPSELVSVFLGKNVQFSFKNNHLLAFTAPNEQENCILIDLHSLYLINYVKFYLSYINDYYIEVSTTKKDWTRVSDYSHGRCSKDQELYFSDTIARFIKIVAQDGGKMNCNSFQIGFFEAPTKSLGGIVCPDTNVAVFGKAFANFKTSSNTYSYDIILLNGVYNDQGINTPFTAHLVGNGDIIVRFYQPYILHSCRFLLWDFDGRKYSYKVEVMSSPNESDKIISDKSEEWVDGWQTIQFAPRTVSGFRLKGIGATKGNEFRLVHFEAPAKTEVKLNESQKKMKL